MYHSASRLNLLSAQSLCITSQMAGSAHLYRHVPPIRTEACHYSIELCFLLMACYYSKIFQHNYLKPMYSRVELTALMVGEWLIRLWNPLLKGGGHFRILAIPLAVVLPFLVCCCKIYENCSCTFEQWIGSWIPRACKAHIQNWQTTSATYCKIGLLELPIVCC